MLFAVISNHEASIRLSVFAGLFMLFLSWEWLRPNRSPTAGNVHRRLTNLTMMLINTAIMRLLFPAVTVGSAAWATGQNFGLFNTLSPSLLLAVFGSFIALDLIIYLQHLALHKIPLLWRFHRIHHLDMELDLTTGVRFHPVEAIFSLLLKVIAIVLLGAPVVTVILFEVTLNALSLFNHANININKKLEPLLRLLVVTPPMHRVHHSVEPGEYSHNYGFNLSLWDRLFNTYLAAAKNGEQQIRYGQRQLRFARVTASFWQMLKLPFTPAK
ncbi:MAG: sterol desaturase family protein [Pseudomonadales bacterium]|nr:sterol desaturase family protein [Pseudomonadales bacterium]